jgi:hypothetical protein
MYCDCLDSCGYCDCTLVSVIVVVLVSPLFHKFMCYSYFYYSLVFFKTSLLFYLTASSVTQIVKGVPLAIEPDIYLIILTPIKVLQRNRNRGTFVV